MGKSLTMANLVAFLRRQPTRSNPRGNTIHDAFAPGDRLEVDFADDFQSSGWLQYDTSQDASYFGVWVNLRERLILTYAEGDWSLVVCLDDTHYNAEIADANAFYGEGFVAKGIDEHGVVTVFRQDRAVFSIPPSETGA